MNWHAVAHRFGSLVRETPQSVHKFRCGAAGKSGVNTLGLPIHFAGAVAEDMTAHAGSWSSGTLSDAR